MVSGKTAKTFGATTLDPALEDHQLEIASQLYERFCNDLRERSDVARCRLVAGIQVAIRDAAQGEKTFAPGGSPQNDIERDEYHAERKA